MKKLIRMIFFRKVGWTYNSKRDVVQPIYKRRGWWSLKTFKEAL